MEGPHVDEEWEAKAKDWEPSVLTDFSKVRRHDGVISYKLYGQDGVFIPMTCADTYSNRLFVSWVQIHDRYSRSKD